MIRKWKIEEKVRSFALREDEAIWKAIDCQHRLQNSPYFAYSSTREKSNKRSRTRLKTESETGERR